MPYSNPITAIDLHACGEPGRVITGGVSDVPGKSMFEKMQFLSTHMDDLRLRMLRESFDAPELRVVVFGEFSRGKSTLINALLGRSALPAKAMPTTGHVTPYSGSPSTVRSIGTPSDA